MLWYADEFEDDSQGEESNEDAKESFEESYYGAMNEELKNSTLEKSFEHVNQHSSKANEVTLITRFLVNIVSSDLSFNGINAICVTVSAGIIKDFG